MQRSGYANRQSSLPARPSDFDRVKEACNGRWATVIGDLYPALARALVIPGTSRCACPIHGSAKGAKADGFRFFNDFHATGGGVCNTCGEFGSGIDLICWLENAQGKPEVALKILMNYLGMESDRPNAKGTPARVAKPRELPPPIIRPDAANDQAQIDKRNALLSRVWSEGQPLASLADDHQAIRYFAETRGISDVQMLKAQPNMRFHPNLYFARSDHADHPPITFPGIISMMHNEEGRGVGLHHIFLDHDAPKKAPVEKPKKILRRFEKKLNGAIRIKSYAPFSPHSNVCEGVETGVAIASAIGRPVYAAGYATLLGAWEPPAGNRFTTIWCDREPSGAGLTHALRLKERLTALGQTCRILMPNFSTDADEDWNDVLQGLGDEPLCQAYTGQSDGTLCH